MGIPFEAWVVLALCVAGLQHGISRLVDTAPAFTGQAEREERFLGAHADSDHECLSCNSSRTGAAYVEGRS